MRINGLGFSNMTVSPDYVEQPVIVEPLPFTEDAAFQEYEQKYGKEPTEPPKTIDVAGLSSASIFGVPVLWIAGGLILWLIFGKKKKRKRNKPWRHFLAWINRTRPPRWSISFFPRTLIL